MAEISAPPAPSEAPVAPASPPAAPALRPGTIPPQSRPAKDRLFAKINEVAESEAQNQPPVKIAARAAAKAAEAAPEAPETPEVPAGEKPPEKPAEKPATAPADTFPDEAAAGKMRAGELSRHYKGLKKAHNELQAKLATIEAERAAGGANDPERVKLTETLKEREARIKDLDEIVRFKAYEESTEYKTKYETPYIESYKTAVAKVTNLRVIERKDLETGEVQQEMRRATKDDFDKVFLTSDDYEAGILAEQMFGPNAAQVLYHREKVLEINNARVSALETHKKEGAAIARQQAETFQQQQKDLQQSVTKLWEKHAAAPLADAKMGHLFKPIEGDTEGNALLEQGYKESAEAFKSILPPLDPRLSPEAREKVIAMHTELFNKAAAFNRVHFLLEKSEKARKAAEEKLKQFEDSQPTSGNGQRVTNGKPPGQITARDRFHAAMDKVSIPIPR